MFPGRPKLNRLLAEKETAEPIGNLFLFGAEVPASSLAYAWPEGEGLVGEICLALLLQHCLSIEAHSDEQQMLWIARDKICLTRACLPSSYGWGQQTCAGNGGGVAALTYAHLFCGSPSMEQ